MAKAKAKTEDKAPAAEKPKYGVPELAEALGIVPASVRVKLRKSSLTKEGRAWGWNTQKEFNEAVKELKGMEAAEKSTSEEGESKPKRGRKKKTA